MILSFPSCTDNQPVTKLDEEQSYNDAVYPFKVPALGYAYNALEPYIDALTMQIHHNKHHQAYVDNLNAALLNYPELQSVTLKDLLLTLEEIPEEIRTPVRNQGGGVYNHSMFWTIMSPQGGGEPQGEVATAIKNTFGSFDAFKSEFAAAAKKVFGSGWAWLCVDDKNQLSIIPTQNQDNPMTATVTPILCLDVWEHAYYLKYQNRRPDYISSWWEVVNWPQVELLYQAAIKSGQ